MLLSQRWSVSNDSFRLSCRWQYLLLSNKAFTVPQFDWFVVLTCVLRCTVSCICHWTSFVPWWCRSPRDRLPGIHAWLHKLWMVVFRLVQVLIIDILVLIISFLVAIGIDLYCYGTANFLLLLLKLLVLDKVIPSRSYCHSIVTYSSVFDCTCWTLGLKHEVLHA